MGSIRSNQGDLFFDFRYRGQRCREYTKLTDTAANRKRMQVALEKIESDISMGMPEEVPATPELGLRIDSLRSGSSKPLSVYSFVSKMNTPTPWRPTWPRRQ